MTNEAETGESLLQVPEERYGGETEEEDVDEADRLLKLAKIGRHVQFDASMA
ncbi:unnamed protein product, partial [Callosobruchus maculatus]